MKGQSVGLSPERYDILYAVGWGETLALQHILGEEQSVSGSIQRIPASFTYQVMLGGARLLNLGRWRLVKRLMYRCFERPNNREQLPRWLYRRLSVEESRFQGYPVFTLRTSHSRADRVVCFLHGGGGRMRPTAVHYHTVLWLLEHTDSTILLPFYPLSTHVPPEQSRRWIEELYRSWTGGTGQRWVFLGDSAGAVLCARVVQLHPEWAVGAVLLSPAAGIEEMDGEMRQREDEDILLDTSTLAMIVGAWSQPVPLDHPDVNAARVDYRDFPPTFLCYGGKELFTPYVREIACSLLERVEGAQVYEGELHCHEWMLLGTLPETRRLWRRLANFLEHINYTKNR